MNKKANYIELLYGSTLPSRAKSIGQYLFNRANSKENFSCWPALKTIAEQTGYSERTISRAIDDLVNSGFIKKQWRFKANNGGQTSSKYFLILPDEKLVKPKNDIEYITIDAYKKSDIAQLQKDVIVQTSIEPQFKAQSFVKRIVSCFRVMAIQPLRHTVNPS